MVSSLKFKRHERTIAKILGDWFCGDKQALRRTPVSGGWPKKDACGDIIPATSEGKRFPFIVECKNRESWSFTDIWNKNCDFIKWFEEIDDILQNRLEDESNLDGVDRHRQQKLLVFTRNRDKNYVLLDTEQARFCGLDEITLREEQITTFNFARNGKYYFCFKLDDFLDLVDPTEIRLDV